jgi:pyruvate dehydrogenase E2 component (dihydrolipoamide acetyltransferase)
MNDGKRRPKGGAVQYVCEVSIDEETGMAIEITMAVESFEGGTVLKLVAEPDTVIDAGEVIAVLGEAGEQVSEYAPGDAGEISRVSVEEKKPQQAVQTTASTVLPLGEGVKATRLVRNIAQKRNIDLRGVRGTGPRGIITKRDLEMFAASRGREAHDAPSEGCRTQPVEERSRGTALLPENRHPHRPHRGVARGAPAVGW